jgi:hypothetical protein
MSVCKGFDVDCTDIQGIRRLTGIVRTSRRDRTAGFVIDLDETCCDFTFIEATKL